MHSPIKHFVFLSIFKIQITFEYLKSTKYGKSNSWGPFEANAAHEQGKIDKNKAKTHKQVPETQKQSTS